jgi:hypothetical protein
MPLVQVHVAVDDDVPSPLFLRRILIELIRRIPPEKEVATEILESPLPLAVKAAHEG